jgi:predicted DNA-binding transcriptional regulator YafY
VWPLGLVLKAGVWYLVAQVGEATRTYRISNILELRVLDERFERPKDFDLVRFWTLAARAYEVGLFRATAVLRVSPRGLQKIGQLGTTVGEAAVESASLPDAEGWMKVIIPIESVDQGAADLIRLGADAEVLEPPELRDRVAGVARQLTNLYGS